MPVVGLPGNTPCLNMETVGSGPTLVYGVPAIERSRAVTVTDGATPVIRWQMVDRGGRPIDLRACLTTDDGGSSLGGSSIDDLSLSPPLAAVEPRLEFRMREQLARQSGALCCRAHATDAANGWVEIPLVAIIGNDGKTYIPPPGIYIAEVGLIGNQDAFIFSNVFMLYLEPSLFHPTQLTGPPSLAELRLSLRDSSPTENRLLDSVTFDDAELGLAVMRCVQYFNETNPPLTPQFDTKNFPWRYHWCLGASGLLFRMLAEYYRKNELAYSAAGISVDDFNKAPLYEQAADGRWKEYKEWVLRKKIEINSDAAWGNAPSPYSSWWGAYDRY